MQFIVAIVVCMLLASRAAAEYPVRSLLEIRQENLIIQQWDNSCAAAALATILTYDKRLRVSEEEVARGMLQQTDPLRVRFRGGFSMLDMKQYVMHLGFESDGYSGMTLEDLAAQTPMIVPINVRGYSHFVIVRELTENDVYIGDPSFGNYRMNRLAFAENWRGIGFEVGRRTGDQ
jgi:predicted double-glycine peptidase